MQNKARSFATMTCSMMSMLAFSAVPATAEDITVFAAASLRDAVGEIALAFEAETGDKLTLVFAGSSTLARQVDQGAPADVIMVADRAWADWLIEQGAVADTVVFAGNRLVVVGLDPVNALDDPAQIIPALGDERLAMAQVDAVPAGRYGKAALEELGLWDALEPQVVQGDNVRAALRFVERGEALFGIGYASDLVALPTLTEVYGFAADSHPEIAYFGANVTPQGADFLSYMAGVGAQDTLVRWGFESRTENP